MSCLFQLFVAQLPFAIPPFLNTLKQPRTMPKKRTGQKNPSYGFAAGKSGGKKMDTYEDTIEPGSVDDCEC
jgi:hypothetical protein